MLFGGYNIWWLQSAHQFTNSNQNSMLISNLLICDDLGLNDEEMLQVFLGMRYYPIPYNFTALKKSVLECLNEPLEFHSLRNMKKRHRLDCAIVFLEGGPSCLRFGRLLTYNCLPPVVEYEPYPNPFFTYSEFRLEIFEEWLRENNLINLEAKNPMMPLAGQLDQIESQPPPPREDRRQPRNVAAAQR